MKILLHEYRESSLGKSKFYIIQKLVYKNIDRVIKLLITKVR